MDNYEIPTFDWGVLARSVFHAGSEIARSVDAALVEIGCFYLQNSGFDARFHSAFEVASKFFDLPMQTKMSYHFPGRGRGYVPARSTNLAKTLYAAGAPDLFEGFNIVAQEVTNNNRKSFYSPNVWPAEVSDMEPTFIASFELLASISKHIIWIFEALLDAPHGTLADLFHDHLSNLRVMRYSASDIREGQHLGQHTDFGSMTILVHRNLTSCNANLEILDKSGNWREIEVRKDAVLIMLGDLGAIWSGNRWCAPVHRVSSNFYSPERRMTLAYFQQPSETAFIKEIGRDAASRVGPPWGVLAGQHLSKKMGGQRA